MLSQTFLKLLHQFIAEKILTKFEATNLIELLQGERKLFRYVWLGDWSIILPICQSYKIILNKIITL